METTIRTYKNYDHRLKELVRSTQDITCAVRHGVPRSTARGWLRAPASDVISIDVVELDVISLRKEVLQLRARLEKLHALLRVVLASTSTWRRLVSIHKWRRARLRVHPAKPKVGIRATKSNEIWHIDASIVRLLDGTKAYLHAVIDNYSRRILSWKVSSTFNPVATAEILLTASKEMVDCKPMLLADGGVENFNGAVNGLVDSGLLNRVLAQTEITFSNSMIESWWRSLKHQWLFLNTLDSVMTVETLVEFYVQEHNSRLPHSAFHGQTPDEMYSGRGNDIPSKLEASRKKARQERIETNRKRTCSACETPVVIAE